MGRISLEKYGWRLSFGAVVFYFICLSYGSLLSSEARELHHALFEMIPGFIWGSAASVIVGAIYFFVLAWILAWFIVWTHNSSLEGDYSKQSKRPAEKHGHGGSCCH